MDDIDAMSEVEEDMPEVEQDEGISAKRLVEQVIDSSAPGAINRIAQIALHEDNAKTALDAAKYIVDRRLGPVRSGTRDAMDDEWAEIYAELRKMTK